MRKVYDPEFTTAEFMRIEANNQTGYIVWDTADPQELYKAYVEKYLAPYRDNPQMLLRFIQGFVPDFLFEAGRCFGVRQERMRRRGGK